MRLRLESLIAVLGAAILLVPAPLGAQRKPDPRTSGQALNLVWPLPPEAPRIKYVASYRGEVDFEQKKPSRWKRLLLGPEEPKLVSVLFKPYGVAVSKTGQIYVTDTVQRKVFVIDPAAKTVSFLGDQGPGRVQKPIGVALDDDGKAFVADATLKRIYGYDAYGNLIIAIGHEGELENPSGLTLDTKNKLLYVADSQTHRVLCYSATDGVFVRAIGERGPAPGQFNFPTNVSADKAGRLYVADTMNFRVQVFGPDGAFVRAFGSVGDSAGNLARPKGVGVDSEGHIYVADATFNGFEIFDGEGSPLLSVGVAGNGPGEFVLPAGLFVDDQDRIYVADQGNARVQVFQYLRQSR